MRAMDENHGFRLLLNPVEGPTVAGNMFFWWGQKKRDTEQPKRDLDGNQEDNRNYLV
jgi:hypothetical protein